MRHNTHRLFGELYAAGLCESPAVFVAEAVIAKLEAIQTADELEWLQVLEAIIAMADEIPSIDADHHKAEYQVLNAKHRKTLSKKRSRLLKHWGDAEL